MAMNKKNVFFAVAIAMAITIAVTIATTSLGEREREVLPVKVYDDSKNSQGEGEEEIPVKVYDDSKTSSMDMTSLPKESTSPNFKRISRFLAQGNRNPRAASHCNKDSSVCYAEGSPGSTCCNNKCVDLYTDNDNCGTCKKKCKFYTEACCNGKCVNLSYDKRHCGRCNNRCMTGGFCLYGICDYA
ncbi:Stigma-specific protein Stig1 [Macleaya cordata]|uniref:Stigma-specific protein Stig1 n=1 Tax=Macleaya cordata TaxID=56857 RepID=A0A200QH08_MACCD|nr:Stigma-specific protein Stig1 [Macleaya cordata]